ncbi:hypothetical protein AVEN_33235-1, partial [Araneus ventricosus]
SRFEATRGLFWDEPRNFEPQSDDKDDIRAGTLCLQTSSPHQREDACHTKYDLGFNRPNAHGSSVESVFEP